MLKLKGEGLRHFFLGDTEETLATLIKKATEDYGADVVGSYSPPFAPLEEYDFDAIAKMIHDSGANIVWTALRAPKQDFLNAMLVPHLNDGIVCLGVGAAFRSVIGELKQPDGVLQKMGLAGLIFKRSGVSRWSQMEWYVKHSVYLLKYWAIIHHRRIIGKKYYEI